MSFVMIERNNEVSDTGKQDKNRANIYLALALAAGVLVLYLFALFFVDWPSLWRSVEKR